MGSKGQHSTLSEHGHVFDQIRENHECSNLVAHLLPADPLRPHPHTLGIGSIGQTTTGSEHGHVAYPIKGNHEMQQHDSKYFARRPPSPDQGAGVKRSKFNFFRINSRCISN